MKKKSLKSLAVMLSITVLGVVPVFATAMNSVSTSTSTTTTTTASVSQLKVGDVTANGKVDLEDANATLMLALGIDNGVVYNAAQLAAADADGSGKVTLDDATIVLKMALGIPV